MKYMVDEEMLQTMDPEMQEMIQKNCEKVNDDGSPMGMEEGDMSEADKNAITDFEQADDMGMKRMNMMDKPKKGAAVIVIAEKGKSQKGNSKAIEQEGKENHSEDY